MKSVPKLTRRSRAELADLMRAEFSQTEGYRDFSKLVVRDALSTLGRAFAGEAESAEALEAFEAFKSSLARRCVRGELSAKDARGYLDAYFTVQAKRLAAPCIVESEIRLAATRALIEGLERVGTAATGERGAKFALAGARGGVDVREGAGGPWIEIDDEADPIEFDGVDLGEDGIGWTLTETLQRLRCKEETPGLGSDDIVFSGAYVYRGQRERLNIDSVEIDFDAGTAHQYDLTGHRHGHTPPHASVELHRTQKPLLYLSSHVLVESDGWVEIAAAVAQLVREAVENPVATAAGAAVGAIPGVGQIMGAGFAGSLAGTAVDALINSVTDDALHKLGERVHDVLYRAISSLWSGDNIVFETWITVATIRWNGNEPTWSVRHGVGGRVRPGTYVAPGFALHQERDSMTGEGTLHASIFDRGDAVYVVPKAWDPDEYEAMTGKYLYESVIRVIRREFQNPVDPL